MSFHRSVFVAIATVFSVGLTSAAFAGEWGGYNSGCGGCGAAYVPAYAPTIYATPIAPAPITVGGCGGCGTPSAAVTFAAPVAPTPAYSPWAGGFGNGGCGCGASAPVVYAVPAPIYVVNQGPEYNGPGVMVPYRTYAPPMEYAPPPVYPPYFAHPHHYYRTAHVYYHPHMYYGTRPYPHRPYWHG
jgi:hypothetical protein